MSRNVVDLTTSASSSPEEPFKVIIGMQSVKRPSNLLVSKPIMDLALNGAIVAASSASVQYHISRIASWRLMAASSGVED